MGVEVSGGWLDQHPEGGLPGPEGHAWRNRTNMRFNFWRATVRGGYFGTEQDALYGCDFSTDGGYASVDVNRHSSIGLGYIAYICADDYELVARF